MIEIELEEGLIVNVDQETASELEDPSYARQYAEMVKGTIMPIDPTNKPSESTLWKTKHDTCRDHDATSVFLALCQSHNQKFRDEKTYENTLWEKVRDHLNEMGYFVGEGVAGSEKCRQKFANLTSSYLRSKEKRKGRGEGKVQDFPYFQEMDEILCDRSQTHPVLVMDSLNTESSFSSDNYKPSPSKKVAHDVPSGSNTVPVNPKGSTENRKTSVKQYKTRNTSLKELASIKKATLAARKEEFKIIMEELKQQRERDHEEMKALIAMSKKP